MGPEHGAVWREGGAEWTAGISLYYWPAVPSSAARCDGDRLLLRGASKSLESALGLRPWSTAAVGSSVRRTQGSPG